MENGTVSVTAASGCTWSATSGVGWITVTSNSSGTGNGTVGYAIAANNSDGRTGTLTIAGRTFTIEQARPGCALDDIANVARWGVGTGARISGQQVELRAAPGQSAGLSSVCALQADFDLQVDYELMNWSVGGDLNLGVILNTGTVVSVHRGGRSYRTVLFTQPPETVLGQIATDDTRGQLRLVRTGGSVAGFYSSASGWRSLGTTDIGMALVRVRLGLAVAAAGSAAPAEVVITFDNFRVNAGTPAN